MKYADKKRMPIEKKQSKGPLEKLTYFQGKT
jgi:hypothetical protein